jgi:hypothetical protein
LTGEQMRTWLQEASNQYREEHPEEELSILQSDRLPNLSDKALQALVSVLQGPQSKRYRVESNSKKGEHYEVDVDGQDIQCSCTGFEYRGTCSHVRSFKTALVAGSKLPKGFSTVD